MQRLSFSMKKNLSKITIKFFLNKNLAPAVKHGKSFYPLYVLVTYNRKSTQFKSKSEEYFEDIESLHTQRPDILEFEERILRKMVEYEVELYGEDKFTVKGLSEKYPYYATSVFKTLEKYFKEKLKYQIIATNDLLAFVLDLDRPHVSVAMLYSAAIRLFPGFDTRIPLELQKELQAYEQYQTLFALENLMYDFAVIIEWLNGEHKATLEEAFTKGYGNKPAELQRIIALLDKTTGEYS